MARKWTNIQPLEQTIIQMREEDKTRQAIADELGLEKVQIKHWISRYNRRQKRAPVLPKKKERPRKRPINFTLTQNYDITPSMSRKGNCYDNAPAENFLSILKTECLRRQKPKTLGQACNNSIFLHFNSKTEQVSHSFLPFCVPLTGQSFV